MSYVTIIVLCIVAIVDGQCKLKGASFCSVICQGKHIVISFGTVVLHYCKSFIISSTNVVGLTKGVNKIY